MRDHPRTLGTLFLAWAGVQVLSIVVSLVWGVEDAAPPPLFPGFTLVLALASALVGWHLRKGEARMRMPALLLSVISLVYFPVGTLLGIYGLWVTLKRMPALSL